MTALGRTLFLLLLCTGTSFAREYRAIAIVGEADPALELEVVPGAAHPTVHPRGLPRCPEFLAAIRRHIAR